MSKEYSIKVELCEIFDEKNVERLVHSFMNNGVVIFDFALMGGVPARFSSPSEPVIRIFNQQNTKKNGRVFVMDYEDSSSHVIFNTSDQGNLYFYVGLIPGNIWKKEFDIDYLEVDFARYLNLFLRICSDFVIKQIICRDEDVEVLFQDAFGIKIKTTFGGYKELCDKALFFKLFADIKRNHIVLVDSDLNKAYEPDVQLMHEQLLKDRALFIHAIKDDLCFKINILCYAEIPDQLLLIPEQPYKYKTVFGTTQKRIDLGAYIAVALSLSQPLAIYDVVANAEPAN